MAQASNPHLEQFRQYDFDRDSSYQDGLQSMISAGALNDKTEDEKEYWKLRTKIFYYNQMSSAALTVEEVLPLAKSNDTISPQEKTKDETSSTEGALSVALDSEPEPRTLSFAELKELIEQGKTDQIPNNKIIPNDLSKETPSESKAAARRKPWEI